MSWKAGQSMSQAGQSLGQSSQSVSQGQQQQATSQQQQAMEAMQNAMKHAGGVKTIAVVLAQQGDLRFEVSDDGSGFEKQSVVPGTGLTSMRDRIAAVGGRLDIRTAPSAG